MSRPSGALVFVSGDLAQHLPELGAQLAEVAAGVPLLVVGAHGVLSERGELEGQTAASGVVWAGGEAEAIGIGVSGEGDVGLALAEALRTRATPSASAFVFARPRGLHAQALEPLTALRFGALVGGGTVGDDRVLALMPGRAPLVSSAGAMILRGVTPPVVRASPACRLLTPLARISATRGPMVLEIEGEPALEVLSSAARNLSDQPLVFVALAGESTDADVEDTRVPLLLRGIQGVDPARQGVVVSEEVRPGLRMAYAVRDGAAARVDLESTASRLARETAGAAPCFGIYVSCAGRGTALYGAQDVDVRILKARFPDVPLAGLHSSFEIAPHEGVPMLQLYTGVLALFSVPS